MHPRQRNMKFVMLLSLGLFIFASCGSQQNADNSPEEAKADLYYSNGTANLMNGNYTEALDKLLEANALRPNDSKVLNNLGMAYYFKNDVKQALKNITRAIEIDPKNSDARVNLASIYFQRGNLAEARNQYEIVSKDLIYKSQFRTYYNLGLLALKENKRDQARNYFHKSVKEREDYCPANYQLGLLERSQYNFASALDWFRKAQLTTCVTLPEPHLGEAQTLIELREYAKARIKLNYMMEKFGKSPIAPIVSSTLRELDQKEVRTPDEISMQEKINLQRKLEAISNPDGDKTYTSPSF